MKRFASVVQLAALCGLTVGATLAWVPAGIIVGSATALLVGLVIEARADRKGESNAA